MSQSGALNRITSATFVNSVTGTSNQITSSPTTGDVILSLPNGISLGSYQAIAPPVGGAIMPGNLGVGVSSPTATNLIQVGTTAPSLALVTSNGAGVLRLISSLSINYIQSGLTGDSGTEVPLAFSNMLAETEWARFDDTGKFGIGTPEPQNKLDVNGSAVIGTYAGTFPGPTNGLAVSGSVAIGTSSANASALLTMSSTTQGFLPPSMTNAQRNAIAAPTAGLVIYSTTDSDLEFYNGAAWVGASISGVTSIAGTSNQIAASAATGSVTLSLPNGLSLGSYQAIAPPAGGMIMPGSFGVAVSSLSGGNLVEFGGAGPAVALLTSGGTGNLRFASTGGFNYIQSGLEQSSNSAAPLIFTTILVGAEWARFDSTGKFGLGTAAPQNKLDVSGAVAIGSYAGVNTAPSNGLIVSGSVAVGTATAAASALLTMSSTTQGFLPPVMTNTQRNAIGSPATGLTIYSSTDNDIEFYNGSSWIGSSTSGVTSLTGTSNQITVSAATGAVTLSLPNGLSLGSYQATSPPTGGMIMPGALGVGASSITGSNLVEVGSTGPAVALLTSGGTGNLRFASSSGSNYIQSGLEQSSNSAAPLLFTTILAGAEWARFDNTGKLGIATTAPKNKLDVNGAIAVGSYAGVNTAPSNSIIVSGGIAIGVAASSATAGTIQTTPPASSTVTTAFGSTLTLGTPIRNTTGYDIMVNITFNISSYTSSDIVMGVGSSATPTTNTAIAADALLAVGTGLFTLAAYVPNNYYLLVDKGGTLTALNITIVAMAI